MYISKLNYVFKQMKYHLLSRSGLTQHLFSTGNITCGKLSRERKLDLNQAISDAERIVDCPASLVDLKALFTEKSSNTATHFQKIANSNHPLIKTAKRLLCDEKINGQSFGLVVLLISKAAGHLSGDSNPEQNQTNGILASQRALAEITEIFRTSNIVHRNLVNLQSSTEHNQGHDDMMEGNKLALLSGDYLLSTSLVKLAALRNQEVLELFYSALKDMCEAEFVGPRDEQNNPLPAKPRSRGAYEGVIGDATTKPLMVANALGNARTEWTLRQVLLAGSLLGKSCQGALKLGGHPSQLQEQGYFFGKHLALAWQAYLDGEMFKSSCGAAFSLVSAPVLFHLEHQPGLYPELEKGLADVRRVDYQLVHRAVLSGPGLHKTRQLQEEHLQTALDILQQFPQCDARTALHNIITTMKGL